MREFNDRPVEMLREISISYWKSQVLFASVRLGLFPAIGEAARTTSALSGELGLDPDALDRLLLSLTALGLLRQSEAGYSIPEEFRPYLTSEGGKDFRAAVAHMDHLQTNWMRLDESVRSGKPVAYDQEIPAGELQVKTEAFMAAMESIASHVASAVVREFPLHGEEEILDLGCGPGTYFRRFLKAYPGVRATAVDTDEVIPITRRHVQQDELEERVTFRAGDFRDLPLGESRYDLVLLSNVLHIYSRDEFLRMSGPIYASLRPGGHLLVNDFFTDDSGTRPLWGALFSLNMLLNTVSGRNYRLQEGVEMLERAGFVGIDSRPLCLDSTLLIGRKPLP